MFEHMDIAESIYEFVVDPSYNISTMSDSTRAGHSRLKRGEAASSYTYYKISESYSKLRKDMQTTQRVSTNPPVSYMSMGIHQMNARSWKTLVLSMLKSDLLRTAGTIPYQEINLTESKIIMILLIV